MIKLHMKPIYVGETRQNEKIYIDLDKEDIHFIFLGGASGAGKSIFGFNFYKELIENNGSDGIGIIPLDFTQVDLFDWKGEYMLVESTYDREIAFKTLEDLAENPYRYGDKKVFVHIEENALAIENNDRFIKVIKDIKQNNKNVYIVYSTSRLHKEYSEGLVNIIDLKVIFGTYEAEDSLLFLGNSVAVTLLGGERVLAYNNKQILFKPFTEEEKQEALRFCYKIAGYE